MTNLTRAIIAVAVLSLALPLKPPSTEKKVRETASLEQPVEPARAKRRVRIIE